MGTIEHMLILGSVGVEQSNWRSATGEAASG